MSTATLPKRDEIPAALRWDLSDIYPDFEAWEKGRDELERRVAALAARKGTLAEGPDVLLAVLREHDELEALAHRVWWYPALMHDEDLRRNEIEARKQEVQLLLSRAATESAWVRPEILRIGEETIRRWLDEHEELAQYRFLLEDLFRQQEHVLDEARETLLSYAGPLGQAPADAYTLLSTADVRWPIVELTDGQKVKITYSAYHHLLQTARRQEDRRRAFEALYETFGQNRNTYAALYAAVCHRDWFEARARGYASTLEASLHHNAIPTSVVENLIETAREGTAPLRRYHGLRQRVLQLDEIHLYDNLIPLLEDQSVYPYEEAKQQVVASVAPLGEDYQTRMAAAFEASWIDVAETEGKRSGAYSAGVYGVHPYMLLNYKETRGDLFTLAHEMGHSMHTVLSHESQPFVYSDYTIFVAEVASTLNEALLLDHMMQRTDDARERVLLLQHAIDSIVGTFYTQVMFADFELQAHRKVEEGQPVTAAVLEEIYGEILDTYHGDSITIDPQYRYTWARIPHIYRSPYYVYQYATCFASAATLQREILQGDDREAAVRRYLELLRAGSSAHPMDLLRRAGVDLSRPETVRAVVAELDTLVSQLETELARL